MNYSLSKVAGICMLLLIVLATLSQLLTLYIGETAHYRQSELRIAKCKRDKESQDIFSEECRIALEHINHYPSLRAVEKLGRSILAAVRHSIADVFDTWAFMFLMLLVFMAFIFWSSVMLQRTRERWQYEKHFGRTRALPPISVPTKSILIDLPRQQIDSRVSMYNRKKRVQEEEEEQYGENDTPDKASDIDYNKINEQEQKGEITEIVEDKNEYD